MGCARTRHIMARPKLCAMCRQTRTRGRLRHRLPSSCAPKSLAHHSRVCTSHTRLFARMCGCGLCALCMHTCARAWCTLPHSLTHFHTITASLGAKNGVPAREYTFQIVKASTTSGKYSDIMISDCKKIGMKPVCDNPSYCKTDTNAVYLGQSHHIAHGGHRATSS